MIEALVRARDNLKIAQEIGVKIASGFDASTADGQGKNAHQLIAMTKLGLPASKRCAPPP
jgi:hypothetical protein